MALSLSVITVVFVPTKARNAPMMLYLNAVGLIKLREHANAPQER
jgi:hypothetical protein